MFADVSVCLQMYLHVCHTERLTSIIIFLWLAFPQKHDNFFLSHCWQQFFANILWPTCSIGNVMELAQEKIKLQYAGPCVIPSRACATELEELN